MKIVIATLLLLPLLGHAETREAPASLQDLRAGDTLKFPKAPILRQKHDANVLEINYYFSRDERPSCRIKTPNLDNVEELAMGSQSWKLAEAPRLHHRLLSGFVSLSLEDPASGKKMTMVCDREVELDMLFGIDFSLTLSQPKAAAPARGAAEETSEPQAVNGASAQ